MKVGALRAKIQHAARRTGARFWTNSGTTARLASGSGRFDDAEGQPGRYSFDLAYEVFRQMALWPGSDAYGRITIHR